MLTVVTLAALLQGAAHRRLVGHTTDILGHIDEFELALERVERRALAYALSGSEQIRERYSVNVKLVGEEFAELDRQTTDNPLQQKRLDALEAGLRSKIARYDSILADRLGKPETTVQRITSPEIEAAAMELRRTINEFRAEEKRLLVERMADQERSERFLLALYAIALAVNTFAVVWGYRLAVQYTAERDEAEARVQEANSTLEQRIAAGTEDLKKTVGLLQRSNAELERFAFIASHDLQEPLRQIGSYVSLIDRRYKTALDEDGLRYLEYAVSGAKRMQDQINDLLAYSSLGSQPLEFGLVSLDAIAARSVEKFRLNFPAATIRHTPLPEVWGDARRLERIFDCMLSNSTKFHEPSRPLTVDITAHRQEKGWEIRVADNGIGFQQQYAPKVFSVFGRLNAMSRYPGTGMGLAICKRIVEDHGGAIGVTSEEGTGSTFFFTLPERDEAAERTLSDG